MTGRMLSALAFWRPVVSVTRIDLSDGETLQWSGSTRPRRLRRLRATARIGAVTATGHAERVGGRDDAPGFHLIVDLQPLLDSTLHTADDIVAALVVGRRRARIEWGPSAFDNVNSAVVRPVAPDLARGLQRALRREPRGAGVRIVSSPLTPRHTMLDGQLGATCRVRISGASGSTPTRVEWQLDNRREAGVDIGDGWWEWSDLRSLAASGARWSLHVTDHDGSGPVHLPHGDLRGSAPTRCFPIAEVGESRALTLALGVDGGQRIVLRCRPTDGPTTSGPADATDAQDAPDAASGEDAS